MKIIKWLLTKIQNLLPIKRLTERLERYLENLRKENYAQAPKKARSSLTLGKQKQSLSRKPVKKVAKKIVKKKTIKKTLKRKPLC